MKQLTGSETDYEEAADPISDEEALRFLSAIRDEYRAESAQVAAEVAERERRSRLERIAGRAGIPMRYAGKGFDDYRVEHPGQQKAVDVAREYADHFENVRRHGLCMMLLGNTGNGKTHLACAILAAIMQRGHSGLYLTLSDALRWIRSTYDPSSDVSESEVLRELSSIDLLALDEIGIAIGDPEKRRATMSDILDARYMAGLPTIIMSNQTRQEVHDYLGGRLFERLLEGGGIVVPFTWESYRLKA